eukprot:1178893-Prorocentrum_minimum.AAC.7
MSSTILHRALLSNVRAGGRCTRTAGRSGIVSKAVSYPQQLRSSRVPGAVRNTCKQRQTSTRQLSVTVTARRGGRAIMYEEENT